MEKNQTLLNRVGESECVSICARENKAGQRSCVLFGREVASWLFIERREKRTSYSLNMRFLSSHLLSQPFLSFFVYVFFFLLHHTVKGAFASFVGGGGGGGGRRENIRFCYVRIRIAAVMGV